MNASPARFRIATAPPQPWKRVALCAVLAIVFSVQLPSSQAQQAKLPPARLPSADKIVEEHLKAIGGKKRAAGIRDATCEWEIQLADRTMGLAQTQIKFPSSVRSELSFGNGQIISAATPRSAWIFGLDGRVHTLTDEEAAAARLQAVLESSHLANLKMSNVLARTLSLKTSNTGAVYEVEFSLRSGARLRYLFSTTTRLLMGIEDDARQIITGFDDYRTTGSILEPHRMTLNYRGTGLLTLSLKKANYNTGIPDSRFDPPQPTGVP